MRRKWTKRDKEKAAFLAFGQPYYSLKHPSAHTFPPANGWVEMCACVCLSVREREIFDAC